MTRPTKKMSKPSTRPRTRSKPGARRATETTASRIDADVVAFLDALEHPLKRSAQRIRDLVLDASPDIREGIKWNTPSFRTTEYFATLNVHASDRVRLILHRGAKVKKTAAKMPELDDPAGLLEWLGKDRALITFTADGDVRAKAKHLRAIVREWIRWV